ncbi:hypothetical protein OAJ02_06380 [Nitrosopumilus sp.]|nr:hypothetical protein [Nitrosopumilus sp.]
MKKLSVLIVLIILIAIITTIVISIYSFSEEIDKYIDENDDTVWIHSGPFSIDREEYRLGHKIFLIANEVNQNDKGVIKLVKINEDGSQKIFKTYRFDGMKKQSFNIYFSPYLNEVSSICSVEDVIGNYEVIFEGTNFESIKLKIINKYLPGSEYRFEPVC